MLISIAVDIYYILFSYIKQPSKIIRIYMIQYFEVWTSP